MRVYALLILALLAGCERYQIAADERGVWRVDTRSGEMTRCLFLEEIRCAHGAAELLSRPAWSDAPLAK